MEEMVNWPGPFNAYTDSGEGGLFAWMVVPEALSSEEAYGANTYGNNCHVDVTGYLSRPRAMLTSPDVCVNVERNKIYEPYKHRDSWFDHSMTLTKRIGEKTPEDRKLRMAVIQAMGSDDVSIPMLTTVFLGSTCHSLYNDRQGAYFTAAKDDLTANGTTLYTVLQQVYGVDPVILTFLDT